MSTHHARYRFSSARKFFQMLTPIGPRSHSRVILKNVHFRQVATKKRTITAYLARKNLKLAWFMNAVLDPHVQRIEAGLDPFPNEGRPLTDDEDARAA